MMARLVSSARSLTRSVSSVLSLNGSTAYVSTGVAPSTTAFGVMIRAKLRIADGGGFGRLLSCVSAVGTNGFELIALNKPDALQYVVKNGTTSDAIITANLVRGDWSHITINYEQNNARIYVNGTLVGTDTSCTMTSPASLVIGRQATGSGNLNCLVADYVLVNGSTLTQEQINDHMLRGVAPACTQFLKFNDGSGSTANDSSGNGNNATITSGAWNTSDKYMTTRTLAASRTIAAARAAV